MKVLILISRSKVRVRSESESPVRHPSKLHNFMSATFYASYRASMPSRLLREGSISLLKAIGISGKAIDMTQLHMPLYSLLAESEVHKYLP